MQIEPVYTYYIDTFDLILSDNGLTNVIKNINIIIVASYSYFVESSYYKLPMAPPSEESFIDYELLTKEIVLGWVNECNDVLFLAKKEELKTKINELVNKPIVTIKPSFF